MGTAYIWASNAAIGDMFLGVISNSWMCPCADQIQKAKKREGAYVQGIKGRWRKD